MPLEKTPKAWAEEMPPFVVKNTKSLVQLAAKIYGIDHVIDPKTFLHVCL